MAVEAYRTRLLTKADLATEALSLRVPGVVGSEAAGDSPLELGSTDSPDSYRVANGVQSGHCFPDPVA